MTDSDMHIMVNRPRWLIFIWMYLVNCLWSMILECAFEVVLVSDNDTYTYCESTALNDFDMRKMNRLFDCVDSLG